MIFRFLLETLAQFVFWAALLAWWFVTP